MTELIVRHRISVGIPFLTCAANNGQRKKVIFLFHRLLQSKEFELPQAYMLAQAGYYVVLLDFKGHGERQNSFTQSRKYDFDLLFDDVAGMVDDVEHVLEVLQEEGLADLDLESVGMVGVSIGGMVALTAAYRLKKVQFAVSIISGAHWWPLVAEDSFLSFRFFSTSKHVMTPERVRAAVEQYDPYYHIEEFAGKPILLVNGSMDMAIPLKTVEPFYKKLSAHYFEQNYGERVCWYKYGKCGHEVTPWMMQDIVDWLEKWGN